MIEQLSLLTVISAYMIARLLIVLVVASGLMVLVLGILIAMGAT
jgi:hypothetical protein